MGTMIPCFKNKTKKIKVSKSPLTKPQPGNTLGKLKRKGGRQKERGEDGKRDLQICKFTYTDIKVNGITSEPE